MYMYVSQVWTLCNKEAHIKLLFLKRNALVECTVTLFNNLSWIPFYNEAYVKQCELAYKWINGTLPDYLDTSLRKNSDVHSRNMRNCILNLLCPLHENLSEGGRTFAVKTVKDWNNHWEQISLFKAELLVNITKFSEDKTIV